MLLDLLKLKSKVSFLLDAGIGPAYHYHNETRSIQKKTLLESLGWKHINRNPTPPVRSGVLMSSFTSQPCIRSKIDLVQVTLQAVLPPRGICLPISPVLSTSKVNSLQEQYSHATPTPNCCLPLPPFWNPGGAASSGKEVLFELKLTLGGLVLEASGLRFQG